jgi:putative membrane protein
MLIATGIELRPRGEGGAEMMWTAAPWWHWLGMASFWLVILLTAIWAASRLFPGGPTAGPDARELLDQRLARGELGIEEYRRLRDELFVPGGQEPRA